MHIHVVKQAPQKSEWRYLKRPKKQWLNTTGEEGGQDQPVEVVEEEWAEEDQDLGVQEEVGVDDQAAEEEQLLAVEVVEEVDLVWGTSYRGWKTRDAKNDGKKTIYKIFW